MIISRTPYRISFFGGGSDYPEWYLKNGGQILSTTINKFIYISCRELPKFFKHNYRISYSKIEEVKKISQIKHHAVRKMISHLKINKNLEIHYDGDLPSRSGMGSSSSFVVGLLNTLNNFNGNMINKKDLSKKSILFEQKILQECVGSQDQVAASYGGFNFIKFNKNNTFKISKIDDHSFLKKLNGNLILLYTGRQRTAQTIAKRFVNKLNFSKKEEVNEILRCVEYSKQIIRNKNLYEFGKLLDESWKIKQKLDKTISSNELNDLYILAKKNGALGGKLLGAGGGGFFLFYVEKNLQKNFLKKMKKVTHIPFEFEHNGSVILYNKTPE